MESLAYKHFSPITITVLLLRIPVSLLAVTRDHPFQAVHTLVTDFAPVLCSLTMFIYEEKKNFSLHHMTLAHTDT